MNDKQLKACIDYINANVATLHGVLPGLEDVGPDATVEMVEASSIQGSNAVLLVNRGIKGTCKYILDLKAIQSPVVEVEAKKVDTLQAKLRGKRK